MSVSCLLLSGVKLCVGDMAKGGLGLHPLYPPSQGWTAMAVAHLACCFSPSPLASGTMDSTAGWHLPRPASEVGRCCGL